MRTLTKWIVPFGLAALAAACAGGDCTCGRPDGSLVQESRAPDGSCASLAGEGSPYEYCVEGGAAGAVSPFDAEPRLTTGGDSAPGWRGTPVPRSWTP